MIPSLEFNLRLPIVEHHSLIAGQLIIKETHSGSGIKVKATSGLAKYQFKGSSKYKGRGCLPSTNTISPDKYTVSTQRLWLPNIKGVEGSFYAIAPFMVNAGDNVKRGDLGIHHDSNVPGSAGCIVIQQQDHWDIFRAWMQKFRENRFQSVPLLVIYT